MEQNWFNKNTDELFKYKIYNSFKLEICKNIHEDYLDYLQYNEIVNWFTPDYLMAESIKRSVENKQENKKL